MSKQPIWVEAKLGDLGRFSTSSVDKKLIDGQQCVRLVNYMDVYNTNTIDSNIDFMEVTASQVEVIRSQVEIGDILFTPSSETPDDIGHSAVVNEKLEYTLHSYHTVRFRPNSKQILDLRFSAWFANSDNIQKQFYKKCSGSTRYTLTIPAFESIKFKYPKSLSVQKKIASYLDTINLAIEKTKALIEKYQQIKAGLMHDLFTRGITADGKLRPPREQAPELYQETPIGWIPKEWMLESIEHLGGLVTSGSRDWAKYYSDEGDLFIRIGNLTREHINFRFEKLQYVSPPANADGQRTKLIANDILVSITADLGIIGVISEDLGDAYINQHIALIRFSKANINCRFVGYFFSTQEFQGYVNHLNDSGAKAGLNLPVVRAFPVIRPTRNEQNAIAQKLDAIVDDIDFEKQVLTKLRYQKKGLMHDLLTGKVSIRIEEIEADNV